MIAIALAAEPDILIADEPTTALDVTIQAQILDLLKELQRAQRMAMLLITHDLAVVARMAHRVALMYAGQIIEVAEAEGVLRAPQHPYAVKLFEALPDTAKRGAPARGDRRLGAAARPGVRRLPLRRPLRRRDGAVPDDAAAAARTLARPSGALPALRRRRRRPSP